MDYHANRFEDHSLVARKGDEIIGLLPANRVGDVLHSHQGLTYGGMIVSDTMTTPVMLDLFCSLVAHLRRNGIRRLHYKSVPSIYHRIPAEEDRYALFRVGASLARRDVLSVIAQGRRGPAQTRRRRGAAKARKHGVVVEPSRDWRPYWALLSEHLDSRYRVSPIHSIAEIELLCSRFPENIALFEAKLDGDVIAGATIFESAMVAHVQYIAASPRGRATGALDALFEHLIEDIFATKPCFDFGISNEQEGRYLNRSLIEQKEGFGARAVVHDFYTVEIDPLS
jgi:hypothetical protein